MCAVLRGYDAVAGVAYTLRSRRRRVAGDQTWAVWSMPRKPPRRWSGRGWDKGPDTASAGKPGGVRTPLGKRLAQIGKESAPRALSSQPRFGASQAPSVPPHTWPQTIVGVFSTVSRQLSPRQAVSPSTLISHTRLCRVPGAHDAVVHV